MSKRIQKDAAASEGDLAELKNIKVQEVSLVDRAANRREFLIMKKDQQKRERSMRPATEAEIGKGDPATTAEPVAPEPVTPVVEAVVTPVEPVAPAAPVVEPVAPVTPVEAAKSDPATVPATAAKSDPATVPATAVTPVEGAVTKDTTVISVEPDASGAVTVTATTTEDDITDEPTSTVPADLVEKIRAATLAGIDAISARITAFRTAVDGDKNIGAYGGYGSSVLYDHVWYIEGMLESLFSIGGPAWEIEQAGDDVAKAAVKARLASVLKAHKAITAARVTKMSGIHKAMAYCTKDMGDLVTELTSNDAPADNGDSTSSFAKGHAPAAVVAAIVPEIVPASVPAIVPEVEELKKAIDIEKSATIKATEEVVSLKEQVKKANDQLAEINKKNVELSTLVAEQGRVIKGGQFAVPNSNGNPKKDIAKDGTESATVTWPRDLAADNQPKKGRSFRH